MNSIETLTFEEALANLEEIVQKLEAGTVSLEESISYYEHGMALKKHCESKLKAANLRVEKITLGNNGEMTATEMV